MHTCHMNPCFNEETGVTTYSCEVCGETYHEVSFHSGRSERIWTVDIDPQYSEIDFRKALRLQASLLKAKKKDIEADLKIIRQLQRTSKAIDPMAKKL
jgi:hypothetical protein